MAAAALRLDPFAAFEVRPPHAEPIVERHDQIIDSVGRVSSMLVSIGSSSDVRTFAARGDVRYTRHLRDKFLVAPLGVGGP